MNEESKTYFAEKLESCVLETFKKDTTKAVEEVKKLLENFESIEINSELITLVQSLLQDLQMYESQKNEIKSVTSVIPEGSECEELTVYVTQRILNSGFTGGYTDNYVAYPYTYLFNFIQSPPQTHSHTGQYDQSWSPQSCS